ncbi:hypothetical protein W02_19130 [Nitrospira sp. KM1]|uniref:hypothetical protein n=1 Tax=Nitrospira sp. KM1 TaxID=1936990 RepID=UPI0013A7640F|nr:hypothetical protein [Nitrospira sp. KM1]BCA54773.1 hypothetical protein W02_19130 [Nitrospira sp. KM1]
MHVTLDQEQWEVTGTTTLGEVLADVSERAHARARIVTSLIVDQRNITDRDLDPGFLAEQAIQYSRLTAVSQSRGDIVQSARPSISRFSASIRAEGISLVDSLRSGRHTLNSLDLWLGTLADYLECLQTTDGTGQTHGAGQTLATSVRELLKAREAGDSVLMADVLEYEILPRLEP